MRRLVPAFLPIVTPMRYAFALGEERDGILHVRFAASWRICRRPMESCCTKR